MNHPKLARRSPAHEHESLTPYRARSVLAKPNSRIIPPSMLDNQKSIGECIPCTVAGAVGDNEISRLWTYNFALELEGMRGDRGTTLHHALQVLREVGTLKFANNEADNDVAHLAIDNPIEPWAREQAASTKLSTIATHAIDLHDVSAGERIADAIDETGRPVMVAQYVNSRFESYKTNEVMDAGCFVDDGTGGGHGTLVRGYDRECGALLCFTPWKDFGGVWIEREPGSDLDRACAAWASAYLSDGINTRYWFLPQAYLVDMSAVTEWWEARALWL